ncbi:unnamed protein product [Cladocopium goreaui]|uniref:HMG box domain-containing protein n=1 Tax=Cladocopium goreaui TaxID=2562237 RepID=A0A9P1BZJ6_9DINO|nr:unnamed protein product [Cladocopium goreaui]|mmetsp:Transcript_59205/g.129880  ORF Transcript_59205/g.129880 Transcript_59205/m.129880 type:complete len:204 (+) Transcript_59205:84-695(+)
MGFGDASAKDKKAAAAKAKDEAAKAAAEDASWQDTDKGVQKKAQRAADAAAKADAKLAAKAELKELERQEEEATSQMKGANKKASGYPKVTQAEIARRQALMGAVAKANPKKQSKKTEVVSQPKLEANTNRQEDVVDASGIDAALSALDVGEKKQVKMTYAEFEARELDGIRQENPGLKMSQAKERCFKMWERSPENPKNQDK